jgi:hypothetical protein
MTPRARYRVAVGCAVVLCAACEVDGVTPICPSDAGTCFTLPPDSGAGLVPAEVAAAGDAAADGTDGRSAASP